MQVINEKLYARLQLPDGSTIDLPVLAKLDFPPDERFDVSFAFKRPPHAFIAIHAQLLHLRDDEGHVYELAFVNGDDARFVAKGNILTVTVRAGENDNGQ